MANRVFEGFGALIGECFAKGDSKERLKGRRSRERGNVFFTLFGAVAVVGVLGAGIMSTMRGPLSTMVEVNRIEETKAEMAVGLRLILLTPYGTADGDALTEPAEPDACAGAPTGAGCIPSAASAKKKDAWGVSYAYCAWNNGSDHAALGRILGGGTSTNNIAVALISAGPDRQFQTTCADEAGGFINPDDGGGDDIVRKYNYNDAVAGTDGLWALQTGVSGDEARVQEEISVGGGNAAVSTFEGGATFGNNIQTEGNVNTDVIGPVPSGTQDYVEFTHGILLGDTASCTDGMLRINAGKLQLCMGGAWDEVGKALWIKDTNGMRNDDALAAHVGIGGASSTSYSLVVDGGSATDTLKATGAADFDSTLNVDGAATLGNTVAVDGAATLNNTLGVVGATEFDSTLGVDGTSEFRDDARFISDVFIEKTAGGTKGTLIVQDTITATEGDITASAGNVVATAGDVIATGGNVEATAGNVIAGDSITAANDITATTGDITATAGKITATAGDIEAENGKVIGESFHRGSASALDFSNIQACDPETEKTVWSNISGWGCEPDNGTGTGASGESTLQDVLGRGNDAQGQDAEDFGKIGADEYCDAGLASCVSTASLIAGSSIWKNDGPGSATGEIYYSGGNVGIGTNDPAGKLHISSNTFTDFIIESTGATSDGDIWTSNPTGAWRIHGDQSVGNVLVFDYWTAPSPSGGSAVTQYPLAINTAGNVGIGTNDPIRKMDVRGSIGLSGTLTFIDPVTSTAYPDGWIGMSTSIESGANKWLHIGGITDNTDGKGGRRRVAIVGQQVLLTGRVGIGGLSSVQAHDPKTALDIGGTLRIGDGTELCNSVDHEGALKYDAAADKFYMCRNSTTGWEELGTGSGSGSGGDTMVSNWPDAIICTPSSGSFSGDSHILYHSFSSAGARFYIGQPNNAGVYLRAGFNAPNGSFNYFIELTSTGTVTNLTGSCASKTIAQLYAEGKAFNFVGGGGSGSDTLAGLSCTSGQIAKWNGTAWACAADATSGGAGGLVYAVFAGATGTIIESNGVASVTRTGTGVYSVTLSAPMSTNTFPVGISINSAGTRVDEGHVNSGVARTTTVFGITTERAHPSTGTTSAIDPSEIFVYLPTTGGSGSGSGIWSDSGNGYIEYNVADAGVKLDSITGMAQPQLGLATGMTWDEGTSSLNVTGNITYTGTLTDASDRRLKTDIESLGSSGSMLDAINAINTYSFHMKDNANGPKEFGVMAQELEGIFPNLVHTADDALGTKSVNYMGLIAPMIQAMKELSRRNETLTTENETLRETSQRRFSKLEEQIAVLSWIGMGMIAGFGVILLIVMIWPRSVRLDGGRAAGHEE